jgi:(p)ppGpp synthase/HD superfamily hydrolase
MNEFVGKAFSIACQAHEGQKRKWEDNADYIVHPMRVANLVIYAKMRDECISAALLHDVLEDTDYPEDQLKMYVGQEIFNLVKELTNPSCKLPKESPRHIKKEMDFAHIRTISNEAKTLKMLDRLDNISNGNAPSNFMRKYIPESYELAEICKEANPHIHSMLIEKLDELKLKYDVK